MLLKRAGVHSFCFTCSMTCLNSPTFSPNTPERTPIVMALQLRLLFLSLNQPADPDAADRQQNWRHGTRPERLLSQKNTPHPSSVRWRLRCAVLTMLRLCRSKSERSMGQQLIKLTCKQIVFSFLLIFELVCFQALGTTNAFPKTFAKCWVRTGSFISLIRPSQCTTALYRRVR